MQADGIYQVKLIEEERNESSDGRTDEKANKKQTKCKLLIGKNGPDREKRTIIYG